MVRLQPQLMVRLIRALLLFHRPEFWAVSIIAPRYHPSAALVPTDAAQQAILPKAVQMVFYTVSCHPGLLGKAISRYARVFKDKGINLLGSFWVVSG